MTPSNVCRKRFAALRHAYATAIAEGEPIKAGNIARQMAKVRKAAWSIKVLEDRAHHYTPSPWSGVEYAVAIDPGPSNFVPGDDVAARFCSRRSSLKSVHWTDLTREGGSLLKDGRLKAGHGEKGRVR